MIKATIFGFLYDASRYPALAALLYPVLTQNFTALLEPLPTNATNTSAPQPVSNNRGAPDAFWGIACTDASFRAGSPEEMYSLVRAQEAVSGIADAFMGRLWPCAQWKMTAAERYSGSFEAKTHFPIMFVNGRYDPVTPLASAHAASAGFEGSVVLTHGGVGHKFTRHPSICTAKAVKAYFVNGTMPEEGDFCEPDVEAFEVAAAGGEGASSQMRNF